MSLQIPGLSPAEGRRLALELGERLNETALSVMPREISRMRVTIQADPNTKPSDLAQQIADEIARELQRGL